MFKECFETILGLGDIKTNPGLNLKLIPDVKNN